MFRCATVLVCLATTAVLLVPPSAGAQYFGRNKVQSARLEFRTLQTEHFDIYYYPEEEQVTREAARMAERWYARYAQLLDDTFTHRQAIVLYASHPDFTQTNVSSATVDEGTGGFTERIKSRIVMPFAPGLGETDHVLGHELAHAFQIDIAKREHQNAFDLPGWFIEGMAEYLSLGPSNALTNMWLRDAKQHHRLPTIEQLENPRYFPYRYGHAFWSYLGDTFGDEIVGKLLRSRAHGVVARLEEATGKTRDELTRDWHDSIPMDDGPDLAVTPRAIVTSTDGGRVHVAPAISPDGRRIMFVSERDRLSLDLFMADAASGAVVKKVISTAADPHFDSLQYIQSAGAWDSAGHRFVLAAVIDGAPSLSIVDTNGASPRRDIRLKGLGEIYNPSWSPDGKQIVFSAMKGGVSDLFVYNLADSALTQLTNDEFADLHPSWSPDGKTIAFASDRFTTSLDELRFGAVRVALLDVATRIIRPLTASTDGGKQISPQWTPDGKALYYVADPDGVSNIYRVELGSGGIRRVTSERGGISGITATSPALAVASTSGKLAFNAYRNGRYEIQTLEQASAENAPVITAGVATRTAATPGPLGKLTQLLANARIGLPASGEFLTSKYDDRLRIESIAEPYVGAAVGGDGMVGGVLRANFGITFGDMLRNRQLQTIVRVGTSKDDYAAQVAYMNRKGRLNWGFVGGFIPARFYGAKRSISRAPTLVTQEYSNLRYTHEFASLTARYNVSRASRFEFRGGARRTGYGWQTVTRVSDTTEHKLLTHVVQELPGAPAVFLGEMQAAYVRDTAVLGPTSPVLGQRVRLDIEPAVGGLMFADVRLDARRYFMPVRPATLAVRLQHTGRYGRDARDVRLTPLLLGLQTLVRGYDLSTFGAERCGRTATSCSMIDQLSGNRFAVMNVEVRAPLLGLLTGNLDYGRLPIEGLIFVDGAMLWTPHPNGPLERDRFSSVGAGVRANLGGFVLETTGVRPFDKPQNGWTVSFLIRPGF